ncbi:helix-turn-helix domain-containing protein [Planctomycetota bacterium]
MRSPQKELEADLAGLETLMGITITIHDMVGIFRDATGANLLVPHRTSHQHPACRTRRNERKCLADCRDKANEHVRRTGRPYVHRCWRKLTEVVVPVVRQNAHVATLFAGMFSSSKAGPLPTLEGTTARNLGSALTVYAQGLLARLEDIHRVTGEDGGREAEIRKFLMYRAQERVRLDDLAGALHLSPSRTSHVVKELFGVPFRTLLLRERLFRARALLLGRDYLVGQVARQAGFEDEYHFNHAFSKEYGLPPGRFRRRHRIGLSRSSIS